MIKRILFSLFLGCFIFLTFNKHSKSGYFNYHSEIWGDKAGYYVYLPLTFIYSFSAEELPEGIVSKTGNGFKIEKNQVFTKYSTGVSVLQTPFFLTAHAIAPALRMKQDGFSPIYHWAINVAAIFYLFLGIFFLFKTLKSHFKESSVLFGIVCIVLGTNLYYYSIDETGMSHIFSFAMNCAFLYFITNSNYLIKFGFKKNLLLGVLIGLTLLVRPSNILFLLVGIVLFPKQYIPIQERVKQLFIPKKILPLLIGVFLISIPQMFYWHYTSGNLIQDSYTGESFNFLNPELIKFWFASKSGLFSYNPIYLILIVFTIVQIIKKDRNSAIIGIAFIAVSLFFSSWWDWSFGCSMGSRNFVEYSPILIIPLIATIDKMKIKQVIPLGLLCCIFIAYNLKISYSFDGCFYGASIWDWTSFIKYLK